MVISCSICGEYLPGANCNDGLIPDPEIIICDECAEDIREERRRSNQQFEQRVWEIYLRLVTGKDAYKHQTTAAARDAWQMVRDFESVMKEPWKEKEQEK